MRFRDKSAFLVYVFGTYEKFIPSYIYFINKNYPDEDILIFSKSRISKKIKVACKRLKKYRFIENFLSDFYSENESGYRLLRYVIPYKYVQCYRYLYIGDVDIFILKESLSLFEFHKNQMNLFGLPFSNKVRILKNGALSQRLTGLHFIDVKKYYNKTGVFIEEFLKNSDFSTNYLKRIKRDEHFLYKYVKEFVGFDERNVSKMKRPWHGFHLGALKQNRKLLEFELNENSLLSLKQIREQLEQHLTDNDFRYIIRKSFFVELIYLLDQLKIKKPFYVVFYFILYKIKIIKSKVIRKLV